jgi:shikimate dehydrogenase|tara:strand:+ start:1252 stop:2097 length:846 start_codon:yes stop_codon:yes gene_type:complete
MKDLFDLGAKKRRFGVVGHPVEHSKSPQIHRLFAQQCRLELEYMAIQLDRGGFVQGVHNLQAGGVYGLNVTLPFKEEACQLCDHVSDRAEIAAAVNTLCFRDEGDIYGDNTDGVGLVTDVEENLGLRLRGRKLLLLGAGGAARGVLQPLLEAGPQQLVIANRTAEKARQLAFAFAGYGPVEAVGLDHLSGCHYDLVVNATSASLSGEIPPLPGALFAADALAYDMMYGDEPTVFMRWAEGHGAGQVSDGLGMLVEQAAASFYLWNEIKPQTEEVIRLVRQM